MEICKTRIEKEDGKRIFGKIGIMIAKYKQIVKAMYPNAYSIRESYKLGPNTLYEYYILCGDKYDDNPIITTSGSLYTAWRDAAYYVNVTMMKKLES
jgi:5'-3' exonuclease